MTYIVKLITLILFSNKLKLKKQMQIINVSFFNLSLFYLPNIGLFSVSAGEYLTNNVVNIIQTIKLVLNGIVKLLDRYAPPK